MMMIDLVCILQKTECSTSCCVYGTTHHSCTCANCDSFLMMLAKRVDICDFAELRLGMVTKFLKNKRKCENTEKLCSDRF